MQVRRVVLLGFMASGKTSIGRRLASRLGWRHVDLDREIEIHAGSSITTVFRHHGEAAFRALEAELTPRLAHAERVVFTPGGGWITNPALLEAMPAGTLSVWLQASPEAILARLQSPGQRARRPLLAEPDLEASVRRRLRDREPLYRRADLVLPTDGRGVAAIAAELEQRIRGRDPAPR